MNEFVKKVKRVYWWSKHNLDPTFVWWRLKNAFRYGKIGFGMSCSCCYYEMYALMLKRFEQMLPHYSEDGFHLKTKPNQIRRMKTCIYLLKRLIEDEYPGMYDLDNPLLSKHEAALTRAYTAQRDLSMLCDIMKKHFQSWWW